MSNPTQPDTNLPFDPEFFYESIAWFAESEDDGSTPRAGGDGDDEASTPRAQPAKGDSRFYGQIYTNGNLQTILREFVITGPGEKDTGYSVEAVDGIATDPSKEDDSKLEVDCTRITYPPEGPDSIYKQFKKGEAGDRIMVCRSRWTKDSPNGKFNYHWQYLVRRGSQKH